MIVAGFSAYSRVLDLQRFREIADAVGAYLFVDMAHVAGLVAAGIYPNPVPFADVVTTTTHKTLRGPRGGLILARANDDITKKLNSLVFPGTQGGPLMHVIAAKAVALARSAAAGVQGLPEAGGRERARDGARLHEARLQDRLRRHRQSSVPARPLDKDITGKDADAALGRAHITVNKNAVPNDPRPPMVTSGMRIGTPAGTTRGFKEARSASSSPTGSPTCSTPTAARPRSTSACSGDRAVPALPGLWSVKTGSCRPGRVVTNVPCTARSARTKTPRSSTRGWPAEGAQIRRRRECLQCGERFTTFETAELVMPLRGQERRAPRAVRREQAARRHARRRWRSARCRSESIEEAVGPHHATSCAALGEREVTSRQIGELVMEELHKLDEVAYVRFASVYRSFQDVDAFREEIERMRSRRGKTDESQLALWTHAEP